MGEEPGVFPRTGKSERSAVWLQLCRLGQQEGTGDNRQGLPCGGASKGGRRQELGGQLQGGRGQMAQHHYGREPAGPGGSCSASKSLFTKPFHAVPNGRMQVRGRPEDFPRDACDREIRGRKLFRGVHCQPRHP